MIRMYILLQERRFKIIKFPLWILLYIIITNPFGWAELNSNWYYSAISFWLYYVPCSPWVHTAKWLETVRTINLSDEVELISYLSYHLLNISRQIFASVVGKFVRNFNKFILFQAVWQVNVFLFFVL